MRFGDATAIGRSLPALICAPTTSIVSNISGTLPAMTSVSAGPLPLYGTCVRSTARSS